MHNIRTVLHIIISTAMSALRISAIRLYYAYNSRCTFYAVCGSLFMALIMLVYHDHQRLEHLFTVTR